MQDTACERSTATMKNPAMTKTRTELDSLLGALEVSLPMIIQENPADADFWPAFACDAAVIENAAGTGDHEHVRGRFDCMLADQGLIPGDGWGDACN